MQPNVDRKRDSQEPFQRIQRRSELEAKLLAFRSGWLKPDEIRVRRLKRELSRLLDEHGTEDSMARSLLD